MKILLRVVSVLVFFSLLTAAKAQTYWDAANPHLASIYSRNWEGPCIASSDALFGIMTDSDGIRDFAFWTKFAGWTVFPYLSASPSYRLTIKDYSSGFFHSQKMMTLHDHYLYAVGFFTIDGYTNPVVHADLVSDSPYTNCFQIVRFDFNTGLWEPLGQSFTATNVVIPTTIAVDSSNRIYVGFYTYLVTTNTTPVFSSAIDMLDVSTNGGATWSTVGTNLNVPEATHLLITPDFVTGTNIYVLEAGISALYANGTNIYVGGDFTGSGSVTSSNLIEWDSATWHSFGTSGSGVVATTGTHDLSDVWGIDTVNDIAVIGTNVYVAGNFNYPSNRLARFSSVTHASLPTGNPGAVMNWGTSTSLFGGTSLAVNNGNLYFGGRDDSSIDVTGWLVYSGNPTASGAPSWTTNVSADAFTNALYSTLTYCLTSATNGNAVYVGAEFTGQDSNSVTSDGFARLVISDDTAPSATMSVLHEEADVTVTVTGTPFSTWQINTSVDGTNWTNLTTVTLFNGSATYSGFDVNEGYLYYQITNSSYTIPYTCDSSMTVRISNPSPYDTVTAAIYANDSLVEDGLSIAANSYQDYAISAQYGVLYSVRGYGSYIEVNDFETDFYGYLDNAVLQLGDTDKLTLSGTALCTGE